VPELAQGFEVPMWCMPMADLCFSLPVTGHQAPYVTESQTTFGSPITAIESLLFGLKLTLQLEIRLLKTEGCSFPQRHLCLFL